MPDNETRTTPAAPTQPASTPSSRMIFTLGGLGLVCGILIVAAFQLTMRPIQKNKAAALEAAIFQVIPAAKTKKAFVERDGKLVPAPEGSEAGSMFFAGYDADHRLVGVAVEASGQGFADVVRVLYGYSPARNAIVGMMVLESHETPGLGSKIETDARFKANFDSLDVTATPDDKDLAHPLELAKRGEKTHPWQIEAITGATISSRSVTNLLRASTERTVPMIRRNLPVLEGGGS